MSTTSLLQKIAQEGAGLRAAESRVAEFVGAQPNRVLHMSMASLSAACKTSDPTIMRFCRRLGFQGYQEFKLSLAQSLVPAAPFVYEQITAVDSVANIVRKIASNSINAIQRGLEDIDPVAIAAAADALDGASWVGIFTSGISEITGLDAEHKFQRLGIRCAALVERSRQWLHAETTRAGEIALVFSQSGHTKQIVEVARFIRSAGGRVVAVTAADSPLAEVADILVTVSPYERTELLTPLTSRVSHHLVVNMLVTTIAAKRGVEYPDQLPALDSWKTEKI